MPENVTDSIQRIKEFLAQKKKQKHRKQKQPDIFLFREFNLPNGEASLDLFHGVKTIGMSPYWEQIASIEEFKLAHTAVNSVLVGVGSDIASGAVSLASSFVGIFDKKAAKKLEKTSKDIDIDAHIEKAKKDPMTRHVKSLDPVPILNSGDFFNKLLNNPYETLKDGPVCFINTKIITRFSKPAISFKLNVIVGYDQRGFFLFPKDPFYRSNNYNNVLSNLEHVSYGEFRERISQQIRDIKKYGLYNKIKDFQKFGCNEFLSFNTQNKYVTFFRFDHFKEAKNFKIESILNRKFLRSYKGKGYSRGRKSFVDDIWLLQDFIRGFVLGKGFVLSTEKLNSSEMYPVLLDIIRYFALYTHYNVRHSNQIFNTLLPGVKLKRLNQKSLTLVQKKVRHFVKIVHGTSSRKYDPFTDDKKAVHRLLYQLREVSSEAPVPINIEHFGQEITKAQSKGIYRRFLGRLARHLRRPGPNITLSYNRRLKKMKKEMPEHLRERYRPIYKSEIRQGTICIKGGLLREDELYFFRKNNDLIVKWKDGTKIYKKELYKTWKNGTKIYRDKIRKDGTKILRRITSARGVVIKDFWPHSSPIHFMHKEYNSRRYKFLLTINGANPKARWASWGIDPAWI